LSKTSALHSAEVLIEEGLENCAACSEYTCEKLEKFFEHAPEAKEGLEKIRNEE